MTASLPDDAGYFGIGIYQVKNQENVGMLWRSAYQLGAAFLFTIGTRYKQQSDDVFKSWRHVPLFRYDTFATMYSSAAYNCLLVGVEMGGEPLPDFVHPERAIYLLGAEDGGLPNEIAARCQRLVSIPARRVASYNVAVAGSLVMYDRMVKRCR
ncbi:MAG: RNA methyltransferase [Caldilineaceae bacterium]|nr:RNA methyltransferase [Caldilineaceae bacterium]